MAISLSHRDSYLTSWLFSLNEYFRINNERHDTDDEWLGGRRIEKFEEVRCEN